MLSKDFVIRLKWQHKEKGVALGFPNSNKFYLILSWKYCGNGSSSDKLNVTLVSKGFVFKRLQMLIKKNLDEEIEFSPFNKKPLLQH